MGREEYGELEVDAKVEMIRSLIPEAPIYECVSSFRQIR